MERRRLCWCVLAVLLAVAGPGAAITRPGGDINVIQPQQVQVHEQEQQQQQEQNHEEWPGLVQKPNQWFVQQVQGPTQWPGQQVQGPTQGPGQQVQGPAQWPGQQEWSGQQVQGPNQWPGQQGQQQWFEQQGQQQWPEQQGQQQWAGQQTQGQQVNWNGHQQVQNPEQIHQVGELEQGPTQYPDQKEQTSQIEHQIWEVPPKGNPAVQEPMPSAPWEWEPIKGGKWPEGQAKQPVVQKPTATDLQRVLSDPRLQWPVTVAVDTDPESLYQARRYWLAVDEGTLEENEFDLITFGDTKASTPQRVHGVAALQRALNAQTGTSSSAKGAAFLALLQGSQRAPRDSALLLFTGRPSTDETYGSIASQELVKKGCRLYVWWTGARRFGNSGAERLYREAAQHTGGAFHQDASTSDYNPQAGSGSTNNQPGTYPGNLPPHSSPWQQQEYTQVILAARQGLYGTTTTPVLVDSTVGELHVIILGRISQATLHLPSGAVIDLLQLREGGETQGGAGSVSTTADGNADATEEAATSGLLERRLNTRGQRPGLWQLTVSDRGGSTGGPAPAHGLGTANEGYDVIVKGSSVLRVGLRRPGAAAPASTTSTTIDEDGDLVVTIHGGPTNITGLALLDDKGEELRKTKYKQRVRRDEYNREVIELTVPHMALQQQQQQPMPHYVRVNGYNGNTGGEAFTRITPQIPTTGSLIVTLNTASNLTIQPGTQSQIYLDVINNASRPSRIHVYGSSSRNILYKINPVSFQLNANQRRTVSLQLYAPANMVGVGDTMKVLVYGDLTATELFLETTITNNIYESRDTTRPSLKYRILNNCKEIQSCSSRQWNMEATVEDRGSGIREISSLPHGIIWNPMVIGTKLPVTLKYRASCCDESVIITVSDLQHNSARYTINVNEDSTGLSPGAIAGIVIGALVILIIIIVVTVLLCRKKKATHTFQTQQVAR